MSTQVEVGNPLAATATAGATEAGHALGPGAGRFDLGKGIRYSVANLGSAVVWGLLNFGMPLYLATYNLHPSLIGLLANERSFVGAVVQPVVGRISDRTRTRLGKRRPFFLIGIPLMALSLLLLAFHPPFWIMLAIMTLAAFFLFVASDPYIAMMADIFPAVHRGRVGGLQGLANGAGNILFLVIALVLWQTSEFAVFALTVLLLVLTWGFTFFTVQEPPPGAEPAAPRVRSARPDPIAYIRELRRYPEAAKYTLAMTFFWLGTGGVVPFITLFGTRVLGASEGEAFILPLAATVVTALCAVPAGYLGDRFTKKAVMVGGMLLLGVVALIGSQSQTLLQGTIALAVLGAANAAMTLINPMLVDLVPRSRTAEFVGLGSAVFSFAQPVGSVVAGAIVAVATGLVGSDDAYRWAFIAAGLFVLLAAGLLRTVRPERAAQEEAHGAEVGVH